MSIIDRDYQPTQSSHTLYRRTSTFDLPSHAQIAAWPLSKLACLPRAACSSFFFRPSSSGRPAAPPSATILFCDIVVLWSGSLVTSV